MSEELMVVAAEALMAQPKARGSSYIVTSPLTGRDETLKRGVDFGVVPGTKRPSLYKSGAEKVIMAYGLMCRYDIESSMEQFDPKGGAFFHYLVRCDLVKGFTQPNGEYHEVVYANGYGEANTGESRNGSKSGVNAANNTIKMAQKRAMVQAALAVSGLSSMFSQDIEDETGIQAKDMINQAPTDRINVQQRNRIFNVAAQAGLTNEQAKQWMSAEGYPKSTEITVKQFDEIIEKLKKLGE
jgi:hypothetical protein